MSLLSPWKNRRAGALVIPDPVVVVEPDLRVDTGLRPAKGEREGRSWICFVAENRSARLENGLHERLAGRVGQCLISREKCGFDQSRN